MDNNMKLVGLVLFFIIVLFIITVEVVDCKKENFESDFFSRLERKLKLQNKQIKSQSNQDNEIRKIMNELTKLRGLAKRYSNLS